jgi:hypothetical protein
MLNIILMQTTPAKKVRRVHIFVWETLPTLKRTYPISRLARAHKTFTVGEDNPLPGGFANGVGKLLPDIPCTKCGTALVKSTPAKKQAIK